MSRPRVYLMPAPAGVIPADLWPVSPPGLAVGLPCDTCGREVAPGAPSYTYDIGGGTALACEACARSALLAGTATMHCRECDQ